MNKLSLVMLAVLLSCISCRESRSVDSITAQPKHHGKSTAKPAPVIDVLAAANDHVEAARILAIGVPKLDDEAIRGFALPMYTELPDLSYEQMLERIAAVGATHVSIVTSWDQQTIYHNKLAPHPDKTPSDAQLGKVFERAHELGLKTMLFPIIHVERRDEGEWRGKLDPSDLGRWQKSYRRFTMHHARLAARHNVTVLSIGSELSSQEDETEFWTSLIAEVRSAYAGKLIYSANWDHYDHPQFWSQLDYIGVSSYFEVAKRNDEPIHRVTERWNDHRDDLLDFAAEAGRPLVLTEVGYPSIDSAAVKPWDYTARTPPNANAQLAAFQSLATAWDVPPEDSESFAGLFIWHGWGHGGPQDISYPIWGKSTERLVERWYAK